MGARFSNFLNAAASVCMIAASVGLLWNTLWRQSPRTAPEPTTINLPAGPLPVDGAVFRGTGQVRLILFSDYFCPACRELGKRMSRLVTELVEPGLATIGIVHFPLESIHPLAMRAAVHAVCAERQGLFWEAHESLLRAEVEELIDSPPVQPWAIGKSIADETKFRACVADVSIPKAIRENVSQALKFGIKSTPTIVVATPSDNGTLTARAVMAGVRPVAEIVEAVKRVASSK